MSYGLPSHGGTQIAKRQIASEVTTLPFTIESLFDEGMPASLGKPGKPAYSYATLLTYAILTSPLRKMSLAQIYSWLMSNFPFFNDGGTGWKNSVRHNLSLNKLFVKVARPFAEPGKGCYWSLDVAALHADPSLVRKTIHSSSSRMSPEDMLDSPLDSPQLVKPEPKRPRPSGSQLDNSELGANAQQPGSAKKRRRKSDEAQPGRPAPAPPGTTIFNMGAMGLDGPSSIAGIKAPPRPPGSVPQTFGLTMRFVGGPQAAQASQPIYFLAAPPPPRKPEPLSAAPTSAATAAATAPSSGSAPLVPSVSTRVSVSPEPGQTIFYEDGGVTRIVPKTRVQVQSEPEKPAAVVLRAPSGTLMGSAATTANASAPTSGPSTAPALSSSSMPAFAPMIPMGPPPAAPTVSAS